MSDRQVRVLLTGGIGAGKSSVGDLLRARGALVIDADDIGHQVLEPGGEAYDRVAERWPSVVVEGVIDRRKLADIVFDDPVELRRLEEFTHGAIRERIYRTISQSPEQVVIIEVPLLSDFMGSGWMRVVVDADLEIRTQRLSLRGMDRDDVSRRMAAQPDRPAWNSAADFLIDNSGGQFDLEAQVEALWEQLANTVHKTDQDPGDQ